MTGGIWIRRPALARDTGRAGWRPIVERRREIGESEVVTAKLDHQLTGRGGIPDRQVGESHAEVKLKLGGDELARTRGAIDQAGLGALRARFRVSHAIA